MSTRKRIATNVVLGLSLSTWIASGCAGRATGVNPEVDSAHSRANLILVTLDTLRADRLGCYGWKRATSPVMDAFAREGILFERCLSPISLTTPSHLSMLTGVDPLEHGVLGNSMQLAGGKGAEPFVPSEELQSFAQIAQAQGWRTGGFVSAAPLKKVTGVAVGFEGWGEPDGARRDGSETIADAMRWVDSLDADGTSGDAKFFLWVHLFDAHGPYRAGEHPELDDGGELLGKSSDSAILYGLYVRQLDERVAELFSALRARDLWKDSTIVLVGDHGQGLGQHGDPGHGRIWGEQLQVPFLLKPAGGARSGNESNEQRLPDPGTRIAELVSTLDALPTAIAATPGLDVTPFLAQARGRDALAEDFEARPLFALNAQQKQIEPGDALLAGRWKLLRSSIPTGGGDPREVLRLFDLDADPGELVDLASSNPDVVRRLRARLVDLRREQEERGARLRRGESAPLDDAAAEKMRRELEALGYAADDDE